MSSFGNTTRKKTRTAFGIVCVVGERKYMLIMMTCTCTMHELHIATRTVHKIVIMFMTNVISKYLAINGTSSDVGGRIFETSNRKTTNARRMEMARVIFSEQSAGR